MKNEIMVSVCMITYNHESYIEQAIQGVLMQKCNFSFNLVIGEDFSSDSTRQICEGFAMMYQQIVLLNSKSNLGVMPNFIKSLKACTGKYIAICEGDDYWTDPLKLQKQVDFLEENPEYSLNFHDAIILWEDKKFPPKYFCDKNQKETSTIEDVIEKWFIPSASMVFRSEYINPLPEWFKDVYNGDWALQMLLASKGKIGYLDEVMSVYRKAPGALSAGVGSNTSFVNGKKIDLLNYIDDYTRNEHSVIINRKIASLKRDINRFKLKERSRLLYWTLTPSAFFRSIKNHLKAIL